MAAVHTIGSSSLQGLLEVMEKVLAEPIWYVVVLLALALSVLPQEVALPPVMERIHIRGHPKQTPPEGSVIGLD